MEKVSIDRITKDIYFLKSTKLRQWQNPSEGDTANFRILGNESAGNYHVITPTRLYRCYTFLTGEWCYQGLYSGIDRFIRANRIED